MEGTETENSIPWDGGGSAGAKKKKRRRRSTHDSVVLSLPEHAIIEKDEQAVSELQQAYRILQSISSVKNITPFLDEPTQDKFGMSSYFSVIKKPMWLNEVRRKIECGEYEGLHDFVADLHLMLYNCYKFWGETHRISFRGYIIEHKIETKLADVPWSVKEKMKCPVSSGDCIICDKKTNDAFEDEESDITKEETNPDLVYYNSKGYISKIATKLLNEGEEEVEPEEETEDAMQERLKMEKWEKETLNKIEGALEIPHIPELVDIGLFLKITHEILNVEEMTQYEVERMLLIPLESTTLQTLMTSILSPEWRRNNLDETPLMPYNVWNSKLRQKISSWFAIYYKTCDEIETFERIGIDPYFWGVAQLVNPMSTDIPFHELSFYTRVWVFKSLLDNIFHTNKTIVDTFLEDIGDSDRFRHSYLGKGLMNNHYKAVPTFLPEIRVYKEMSPLLSVWNSSWRDAEDGMERLLRNRMTFDQDSASFGPNLKTFELVAHDMKSLEELVKFGEFQDLREFTVALVKFKEEVETSHIRCEGLKSVYNQYHTFHARNCEYFTNMENLWFSYTNSCATPIKEEKKENSAETPVLGKRRNFPNKLVQNIIDDYSPGSGMSEVEQSESDISDWESSYKNHQRKKKLKSSKKTKLSKLPPQLETSAPPPVKTPPPTSENGLSSSEPSESPLTVKQEPAIITEFKMEPLEVPPYNLVLGKPCSVKIEQPDDTVVISSSDDEDVKPPVAKLKLRDMSTLLESRQPEPSPDQKMATLPNNMMGTNMNNVMNAVPNNMNTAPNNMMNSFQNNMMNSVQNNMMNSVQNNMMMNSVQNNMMNSNMVQNNQLNNAANHMIANLNVVIPPMPGNVMNSNQLMGLNRPMSVQVPPNLYQVRSPRQRIQNPRQVMIRGRAMVPRQQVPPRPGRMQVSPQPVRMPLPKPITPKKPVPKPLLMSPQEWAATPAPTSPATPPRGRTPVSSPMRGRSPVTPTRGWANNVSPRNPNSPQGSGRGAAPRAGIPPKALFPPAETVEAAEGKLIMGPNETGTGYGYQIVLSDGGIRYLTDLEVNAIKRRNNGALPRRVRIPPDGSFL